MGQDCNCPEIQTMDAEGILGRGPTLVKLAEIAEVQHALVQKCIQDSIEPFRVEALHAEHSFQLRLGREGKFVQEVQNLQGKLLGLLRLLDVPLHEYVLRKGFGLAGFVMENLLEIVVERESFTLFTGDVDLFRQRNRLL